jgi:prepilin-type N-terminal cleavage/methylation domain-containing protein/prepilin-type processing-associated H-X9-DG protein
MRQMLQILHIGASKPAAMCTARTCTGFTILELLVVLALVSVLIGIMVPVLSGMREAGQKADTIARLRNIYPMFLAYANDRNGFLPPGHSTARDPVTGKTYGTWMFSLNNGGYVSEPPLPNVADSTLFSCARQLDQFKPASDLRTFAMNNRIGNRPTAGPQGARKFVHMAAPSKTALILNGPWNGNFFSTSIFPEDYRNRMVWEGRPYTVFGKTISVLYADGHVGFTMLSEVPKSIQEDDPDGGFLFWMGGVRTSP